MIIIIILMLLNAIFAIAQSTKPFTRNTRALAKVILIREPMVFVLLYEHDVHLNYELWIMNYIITDYIFCWVKLHL